MDRDVKNRMSCVITLELLSCQTTRYGKSVIKVRSD